MDRRLTAREPPVTPDPAPAGATIFDRLGTRPVINACGIYTDLGGSRLSPTVWAAMAESNERFVRMVDLLESSGLVIAAKLGAEAARVTPGAAASIALMVSAAMTGPDGEASQRLPNTEGLRNEVILQAAHRYKYDRQITMTGARLALAGTGEGATVAEVEALVGPRTAALFLPAHLDGRAGTVKLGAMAAIARKHGVPLLVDAAYMCWPLEAIPSYTAAGADLVCFSAKYFGGPNAGGFVAGSRRMIDAVTTNDFTRYESGAHRSFGRPFKLDRQTVVGVVTAFLEWLAMDHEARWAGYARQAGRLRELIDGIPVVRAAPMYFTMDERLVPEPVNALVVNVDPGAGRTAPVVADALAAGEPSIACVALGDRLIFCFDVTRDDEVETVGARLRAVLAG